MNTMNTFDYILEVSRKSDCLWDYDYETGKVTAHFSELDGVAADVMLRAIAQRAIEKATAYLAGDAAKSDAIKSIAPIVTIPGMTEQDTINNADVLSNEQVASLALAVVNLHCNYWIFRATTGLWPNGLPKLSDHFVYRNIG